MPHGDLQLGPGAPQVKATWSALKYGNRKTSGLHIAAMNTTNLFAQGCLPSMEIHVGPTDCLTALPTGPKHSLFEHFFFFLLPERPYSFCERLKRSPQVHWLNASGHNKHYKPADIKRAQRGHRNSLQALYILSTRIQVLGARTKRYLNNSSV